MKGEEDLCPYCMKPTIKITAGPVVWTCGTATSRAYHHEGSFCVAQDFWALHGAEPQPQHRVPLPSEPSPSSRPASRS